MARVTYVTDPAHTAVHFSVRHMMVSNVRGEFRKVSATIAFDAEDPANSSVEASIDAASINTREPDRDTHLKSADFLDVEKFPVITFLSKRIGTHKGGGTITGDLTIRGVTHEVTLDVEDLTPEIRDPWGKQRIGATATAKLNRKDFGLVWNSPLETGGVLVGEEVKINVDIEVVRT